MGRDPGIPVLRRQRRPLKLLLTLRPRRGPSAWEVVLLDGTLIPTRRRTGADNRKNFSGKHKRHGLRFLALTDTRGRLLWISAARRGAASEITAARHDDLCAELREHGLGAIADLGFIGLDDQSGDDSVIITGLKASLSRPARPLGGPRVPP